MLGDSKHIVHHVFLFQTNTMHLLLLFLLLLLLTKPFKQVSLPAVRYSAVMRSSVAHCVITHCACVAVGEVFTSTALLYTDIDLSPDYCARICQSDFLDHRSIRHAGGAAVRQKEIVFDLSGSAYQPSPPRFGHALKMGKEIPGPANTRWQSMNTCVNISRRCTIIVMG